MRLISVQDLSSQIKNKKIVFVSGIFEAIHIGHMRLLKYAKDQGDILIVGIQESEDTVLSAEDRAVAVSEISSVDYVVKFRILSEIITKLMPEIIVKGSEFRNKYNEEESLIQSYNGRILFSSGDSSFSSKNYFEKERKLENLKSDNIVLPQGYMLRHGIKKKKLASILSLMAKKNVFVIGDVILDEYVTCDAVGLSREDPTVVVQPRISELFLGGAAIVAAHAAGLCANTHFASVYGDDINGSTAIKLLGDYKVKHECLVDHSRPTTHKKRYRAMSKTLLRVNSYSQIQIPKDIEKKIVEHFEKYISEIDLLILSDFSYGVLTDDLICTLISLANKNHIHVVADSQTSSQVGDISRFKNVSLITPTEYEGRIALHDKDSGIASIASSLSNATNCANVALTLGNEGVFIHSRGENGAPTRTDRLNALSTSCLDPAGAGDALMTVAGLALTCGASIWEALLLGSAAAALQVNTVGNLPVKKNQLLDILS